MSDGHVGGADIYPGVFVHLPAQELAAVSAFLAQDLGAAFQTGDR